MFLVNVFMTVSTSGPREGFLIMTSFLPSGMEKSLIGAGVPRPYVLVDVMNVGMDKRTARMASGRPYVKRRKLMGWRITVARRFL